MKVAAYQAPLLPAGSMDALSRIRTQVKCCEESGVSMLCCPEAILGGLADNAPDPSAFAIAASQLDAVLAPLASDSVTSIVGFTELGDDGRLYNSAAVFTRASVTGVYRKVHPAIRRSVYAPGTCTPVFRVGELTFGIAICYDSNFPELAGSLRTQYATALFVPSNTGLPHARAYPELVAESRNADIARAMENSMWVIRADVAGSTQALMSYGASGIVDQSGRVVRASRQLSEDLIVAEIELT